MAINESDNKPQNRVSYVYGPVSSWRSGTSLGIDPIGAVSTCSFNCSYCQLGQIQNVTRERKIYVKTELIIEDLEKAYQGDQVEKVDFTKLDVITFAGSGEPTLALNLGEMIKAIKTWLKAKNLKAVPVSILSNATTLEDEEVRKDLKEADLISLKLDASDELSLKSINQAATGLSLEGIIKGIKLLKSEIDLSHSVDSLHLSAENEGKNTVHAKLKSAKNEIIQRSLNLKSELQLQIMFLPKFAENSEHLKRLAELITEIEIYKIQINTPTRAKPKSGQEYWIETRGNHYNSSSSHQEKYLELPVISKEQAFKIEDDLISLIGKILESKTISPQAHEWRVAIGVSLDAHEGRKNKDYEQSHESTDTVKLQIINVYKR
jgi:wyosine [tRNA(Phe)-imidazoG37] synthetase (radical SAM superfamily)